MKNIESEKLNKQGRSESSVNSKISSFLVKEEGLGNLENLSVGGSLLVTLDTRANLTRLPGLSSDNLPESSILEYERSVSQALRIAFKDVAPVVITQEAPLYQEMSKLLNQAVTDATQIGARVVNLDRFIKSNDFQPGLDYTNISVGRTITTNGIIVGERPGEAPLIEQLNQLKQDLADNKQSKIIIVDDGLFDIECLETYEAIFKDFKIAGYYVGIGSYGDDDLNTMPYLEDQGKVVKSVLPVNNFKDWVCSRDFAPWGGKITQDKELNFYTIPYFSPFSDGSAASIPPDRLIPVSRVLLSANLKLLRDLEKSQNRKFSFNDFIQAGYGLPASNTEIMRNAEPNESITEYLAECLITLDSNYPSSNVINQLSPEISPIDELARTRLELLDAEYGDRLVILVGSSGTGRSTIARGLANTGDFTRLKRVTTRSLRSRKESEELTKVERKGFLQRYSDPGSSDQIITAVKYAANNELYGVSLNTIQDLNKLPTNQLAVIEGTGDVLALKQLLPSAQVIMVLPPSLDSLASRLTDRGDTDTLSRLNQSKRELSDTLRVLPDLIKSGLIDLVIINDDVDKSVDSILNYLSNQEK